MPLSDLAVRAVRPRERAYKVYDRDGLFLLVNPSGSKLWRWRYRFEQKEKLMALGEYPVVTLAEARDRHHHDDSWSAERYSRHPECESPSSGSRRRKGDVEKVGLGCVMENMWLMWEFLGIGFQALSAFSNEQVEKQLKQAFELPEWVQIGFACRIRYSEPAKGSLRVRRNLEQICHHNRFGDRSLALHGTRVNEDTNVLSSR